MSRAWSFGLSAFCVCALALSAPASADDTPAAKPGAKADARKKRTPEQILAKKDKNKDGSLDLKEFAGKRDVKDADLAAKFKKRDKDGDGKITKAELTSGGNKAARAAKKAKKAAKSKKKPNK